jgi:hypothetical protein
MKSKNTKLLLVLSAILVVVPTAHAAGECFQETAELRAAVEEYVATNKSETSDVALRYGWPIGTWCVGNLTSFEKVFATVKLNHDISDWVRMRFTSCFSRFDDDLASPHSSLGCLPACLNSSRLHRTSAAPRR